MVMEIQSLVLTHYIWDDWYIQWTCQTELPEEVWTGNIKLRIVCQEMVFKVMKLDEISQQEWAEGKHGHIASPREYGDIRGGEQWKSGRDHPVK